MMKIKILICFWRKYNYIRVGKGYSELDITNRKSDNTNFILADKNTNEVIRLVNITFACTIQDCGI